MFLVSVAADTDVNTKELGSLLKLEGKVNLRLADEALLMEKLGVKKGCVGPLCIMNNTDKDITLVLDEKLLSKELIHSHPMRNDASVSLKPEDLMAFVKGYAEPVICKFGEKMLPGKVPSSRPEGDKAKTKPKIEKKEGGGGGGKNVNKKQTKKGELYTVIDFWSVHLFGLMCDGFMFLHFFEIHVHILCSNLHCTSLKLSKERHN